MSKADFPLPLSFYLKVKDDLGEGNQILATYNSSSIILYVSVSEHVSRIASRFQNFTKDEIYKEVEWKLTPNYFTIVHNSGWATKEDHDNILALTVDRSGFEEMLKCAIEQAEYTFYPESKFDWTREQDPFGVEIERWSIYLEIEKNLAYRLATEMVLGVDDITSFIRRQRTTFLAWSGGAAQLYVPSTRTYKFSDASLAQQIEQDERTKVVKQAQVQIQQLKTAKSQANSEGTTRLKMHQLPTANYNLINQQSSNLGRMRRLEEQPPLTATTDFAAPLKSPSIKSDDGSQGSIHSLPLVRGRCNTFSDMNYKQQQTPQHQQTQQHQQHQLQHQKSSRRDSGNSLFSSVSNLSFQSEKSARMGMGNNLNSNNFNSLPRARNNLNSGACSSLDSFRHRETSQIQSKNSNSTYHMTKSESYSYLDAIKKSQKNFQKIRPSISNNVDIYIHSPSSNSGASYVKTPTLRHSHRSDFSNSKDGASAYSRNSNRSDYSSMASIR